MVVSFCAARLEKLQRSAVLRPNVAGMGCSPYFGRRMIAASIGVEEETVLHCEQRGSGAGRNADLGVNVLHMVVDRLFETSSSRAICLIELAWASRRSTSISRGSDRRQSLFGAIVGGGRPPRGRHRPRRHRADRRGRLAGAGRRRHRRYAPDDAACLPSSPGRHRPRRESGRPAKAAPRGSPGGSPNRQAAHCAATRARRVLPMPGDARKLWPCDMGGDELAPTLARSTGLVCPKCPRRSRFCRRHGACRRDEWRRRPLPGSRQ